MSKIKYVTVSGYVMVHWKMVHGKVSQYVGDTVYDDPHKFRRAIESSMDRVRDRMESLCVREAYNIWGDTFADRTLGVVAGFCPDKGVGEMHWWKSQPVVVEE